MPHKRGSLPTKTDYSAASAVTFGGNSVVGPASSSMIISKSKYVMMGVEPVRFSILARHSGSLPRCAASFEGQM